MSLVEHARRELELCGQTAEDPAYARSIVDAVAAFASYGHSGGSAGCAREQLHTLLGHGTLSPLTNDPDEWHDHGEVSGSPLWQNRRNPAAFSVDGGQTHYILDEAGSRGPTVASQPRQPDPGPLPTVVDRDACTAAFGKWCYPIWKHSHDLKRYQRIIDRTRPTWLLETGTNTGHSALWFARRRLFVDTFDIDPTRRDPTVGNYEGAIRYHTNGSTSPDAAATLAQVAARRAHRVMVSLDSDHSADHVAREIEMYAPLVTPGCYLVIEDGIIAWLDPQTKLEHGCQIYTGTVLEAIERTRPLLERLGFERDVELETAWPVTMHPAGWWRRREDTQ